MMTIANKQVEANMRDAAGHVLDNIEAYKQDVAAYVNSRLEHYNLGVEIESASDLKTFIGTIDDALSDLFASVEHKQNETILDCKE